MKIGEKRRERNSRKNKKGGSMREKSEGTKMD